MDVPSFASDVWRSGRFRSNILTMSTSSNELDRRSDDALALTRDDLAAVAEAYRLVARAPTRWILDAGLLGGLAIGAILMTVAEALHWPAALMPVFFASGWAITLGFAATGMPRNRRLVERFQWRCLHCEAPMIAAWGGPAAGARRGRDRQREVPGVWSVAIRASRVMRAHRAETSASR